MSDYTSKIPFVRFPIITSVVEVFKTSILRCQIINRTRLGFRTRPETYTLHHIPTSVCNPPPFKATRHPSLLLPIPCQYVPSFTVSRYPSLLHAILHRYALLFAASHYYLPQPTVLCRSSSSFATTHSLSFTASRCCSLLLTIICRCSPSIVSTHHPSALITIIGPYKLLTVFAVDRYV